eukprot:jgi/Psemu1/282841/fgenesh1_pg.14_\
MCKLRILYGIAACATLSHQALSFSTVSVAKAARTWAAEQTSKRRDRAVERQRIFGFSSSDFPPLFAKPLDEEKAENKKNVERWDDEESLLVMSLRPLPGVSCEDSLSRISQYVRGFPVAALLPVQPLQALPTDDGGLDVRFLRRSTRISSGLDGGVRFFVRVNDQSNKKDRIEVVIKRNSEGQSTPKMIAEKLIVQSFAKGMAMGGNPNNDNDRSGSSLIRVPNTRIVSPTKDMAEIQSVFHKWVGI